MYRTIFNAEEKLWSGVDLPSLYNPKISLGHVLLRAMKSNPHKIAQVRNSIGISPYKTQSNTQNNRRLVRIITSK